MCCVVFADGLVRLIIPCDFNKLVSDHNCTANVRSTTAEHLEVYTKVQHPSITDYRSDAKTNIFCKWSTAKFELRVMFTWSPSSDACLI